MVKILGLCGSPRKGATEYAVKKGLEAIAEREGVETSFMTLRGKKIAPCNGCNYCRENKSWCVIKDDMQELLDEFIQYDAFLIGTPVYVHSATPQIMAFFSRMRPLHHVYLNILRSKFGAALAVGGTRNGGEESAVLTLIQLMMTRGINIVSNEVGGYIGGKVWSQDAETFTEETDALGMQTVITLAGKLADISQVFKAGCSPENTPQN